VVILLDDAAQRAAAIQDEYRMAIAPFRRRARSCSTSVV